MTGAGVPVVCTVVNHGFGQGDTVEISNSAGNTAANGTWNNITVIDADTFSLPGSIGDGAYVADSGTASDIDPPIGFESAAFGDGCTSFLASCQAIGGLPNWTGFSLLYEADTVLNYHGFSANDLPNNAFGALKRTGIADAAIDTLTQLDIAESLHRMIDGDGGGTGYVGVYSQTVVYAIGQTVINGPSSYRALNNGLLSVPPSADWLDVTDAPNRGRKRLGAYNNGRMDLRSLVASAASPLEEGPGFYQYGSFWDAGAGNDFAARYLSEYR